MNRKNQNKANNTLEKILDSAEILFSKQGFDGTTTRRIAAGADISIQTLHYHCKSKLNLYNMVLERSMLPVTNMINDHVQDMLKLDLNDPMALKAAVDELIDELFDLMNEHPRYPLLFFRQWIEQERDLRKVEQEHLVPFLKDWTKQVEEQVEEDRRTGVDIPLVFLSLSWIYWGLFVNPEFISGFLGHDPGSPDYMERLKKHAKEMTVRMLGNAQRNSHRKDVTE